MAWAVSALFLFAYTVWAWTPDRILNDFGICYLPNRYYINAWANWLGVTMCCVTAGLDAWGLITSHPRDSYLSMQDRFTKLMPPR
jgi:hypothetical protein